MEGLKPWRDVIAPHPEVCNGTFAQAEFAADLAEDQPILAQTAAVARSLILLPR